MVSEAAHRVRIEGVLDALFLHVELLSWTQRLLLLRHRLELGYLLLAVCKLLREKQLRLLRLLVTRLHPLQLLLLVLVLLVHHLNCLAHHITLWLVGLLALLWTALLGVISRPGQLFQLYEGWRLSIHTGYRNLFLEYKIYLLIQI